MNNEQLLSMLDATIFHAKNTLHNLLQTKYKSGGRLSIAEMNFVSEYWEEWDEREAANELSA